MEQRTNVVIEPFIYACLYRKALSVFFIFCLSLLFLVVINQFQL